MSATHRHHLPSAVRYMPSALINPYFWGATGALALVTGLALSSGPSEQAPLSDPESSHCGFVRVEKGDGPLSVIDAAAANAGLREGIENPADALDALENLKGAEPLYPNDRYVMFFRGGEYIVGSLVSVPDNVNSCADFTAQSAAPSTVPTALQS